MKTKVLFLCRDCQYESPKWIGKCPECEGWNTFDEKAKIKSGGVNSPRLRAAARPREVKVFKDIIKNTQLDSRFTLGTEELDRVLGGGIVPGSVILLGGEPGIGKSTLTLQIAAGMTAQNHSVLYVSGEESEIQISDRAKRLGLKAETLQLCSEYDLDTILATAEAVSPTLLIIDSIQVVASAQIPGIPGSVSQVRSCAEAILEFAKPRMMSVLLIGHVTKDGNLAGPRTLEHLVDGVFILEGERTADLRLLRAVKNRFGATNEVGVFEMLSTGLSAVSNASERFIADFEESVPGTVLTCIMEGTRPMIIEIQALVSPTRFGYPRRTANGMDGNRLSLLIAIMERHLGISLGEKDVFVNIVGGLKVNEPACDIAVIAAIYSSHKNKPLPIASVYAAEVGLSGEIRGISFRASREKEAKKLKRKLIPAGQKRMKLVDFFS